LYIERGRFKNTFYVRDAVVDGQLAILAGLYTDTLDALVLNAASSYCFQMLCLIFEVGIGVDVHEIVGQQSFKGIGVTVDHGLETPLFCVGNRVLGLGQGWQEEK